MLHPVGPLPAAVYWRRRILVLTLLVSALGGGGWLGVAAVTGRGWPGSASAATAAPPVGTPALERVVPSLASVQTPTTVAGTTRTTPRATSRPAPRPGPAVRCADEALGLAVRVPPAVAPGSKPTFELRVGNASDVPCVRALDKGLQELVILDGAGKRIWGSNDCFPEASTDTRTLAPGEVVAFPIVWSGLTSEPTCSAARVQPAPGTYVVRGRLDTKTTEDVTLRLG